MKQTVIRVAKALRSPKSDKTMEELVEGLFSPNEIAEFAKRLLIVDLLKQGISQHEIAARLKVGVATVGRGAKELKRGRFKSI
jgi:TrpR family trp operon transcriptional repressor